MKKYLLKSPVVDQITKMGKGEGGLVRTRGEGRSPQKPQTVWNVELLNKVFLPHVLKLNW